MILGRHISQWHALVAPIQPRYSQPVRACGVHLLTTREDLPVRVPGQPMRPRPSVALHIVKGRQIPVCRREPFPFPFHFHGCGGGDGGHHARGITKIHGQSSSSCVLINEVGAASEQEQGNSSEVSIGRAPGAFHECSVRRLSVVLLMSCLLSGTADTLPTPYHSLAIHGYQER